MLSLDQVRLLESRVSKALAVIDGLAAENNALRSTLSGYEGRIRDLEGLVRDFQQDQGRIEEGILNALERLNAFEDGLQADIRATAQASRVADSAPAEPVSDLGAPPSQDAVPPIMKGHASAPPAASKPAASALGMFSDEGDARGGAGDSGTGVDDFDPEPEAGPASPQANELDIF